MTKEFVSGSITQHFLLRKFRRVLLSVVILMTVSSVRSSENPPDSHEPLKQLIDGNVTNALAASQACVDYYKAQTANLKPNTPLRGWQPLEVVLVGYHLCAKAQIQTMMDDTNGALKTIAEAEKFSNIWSNCYDGFSTASGWSNIVNVTSGFYLETAGDIAGAKKIYLANPSAYTCARLAIIALSNSPDQEVRKWVNKALGDDANDATALAALAALLEKEGRGEQALTRYKSALRHMIEKGQNGNQFLPVTVAECAKVKSAIERLKTDPKSSP